MMALRLTAAAALVVGAGLLSGAPAQDATPAPAVKLQPLKWAKFKERLAADRNVKFTLVDVWATTCGPCKDNFPHLVEMHHKYAARGLGVVSLTLDDPTDARAVAAAEKFLQEKQAVFTNVLLDENFGDGYDRLNINTIPAVFLFDPEGRELKRFTMDDPDNQFTYEQVEKEIAARLGSAEPAAK
jgi:thiol-disulfide isomerase/thioredoxin